MSLLGIKLLFAPIFRTSFCRSLKYVRYICNDTISYQTKKVSSGKMSNDILFGKDLNRMPGPVKYTVLTKAGHKDINSLTVTVDS